MIARIARATCELPRRAERQANEGNLAECRNDPGTTMPMFHRVDPFCLKSSARPNAGRARTTKYSEGRSWSRHHSKRTSHLKDKSSPAQKATIDHSSIGSLLGHAARLPRELAPATPLPLERDFRSIMRRCSAVLRDASGPCRGALRAGRVARRPSSRPSEEGARIAACVEWASRCRASVAKR